MSLGRWLDANGYKQEQPAVRGSGSPFIAPPSSQPLPRMQARPGVPNMGGSMRGPPGIATGRGPHLLPPSAPYAALGLDGLYEEPSVAYALSGQGLQPAGAGMWPQGSGGSDSAERSNSEDMDTAPSPGAFLGSEAWQPLSPEANRQAPGLPARQPLSWALPSTAPFPKPAARRFPAIQVPPQQQQQGKARSQPFPLPLPLPLPLPAPGSALQQAGQAWQGEVQPPSPYLDVPGYGDDMGEGQGTDEGQQNPSSLLQLEAGEQLPEDSMVGVTGGGVLALLAAPGGEQLSDPEVGGEQQPLPFPLPLPLPHTQACTSEGLPYFPCPPPASPLEPAAAAVGELSRPAPVLLPVPAMGPNYKDQLLAALRPNRSSGGSRVMLADGATSPTQGAAGAGGSPGHAGGRLDSGSSDQGEVGSQERGPSAMGEGEGEGGWQQQRHEQPRVPGGEGGREQQQGHHSGLQLAAVKLEGGQQGTGEASCLGVATHPDLTAQDMAGSQAGQPPPQPSPGPSPAPSPLLQGVQDPPQDLSAPTESTLPDGVSTSLAVRQGSLMGVEEGPGGEAAAEGPQGPPAPAQELAVAPEEAAQQLPSHQGAAAAGASQSEAAGRLLTSLRGRGGTPPASGQGWASTWPGPGAGTAGDSLAKAAGLSQTSRPLTRDLGSGWGFEQAEQGQGREAGEAAKQEPGQAPPSPHPLSLLNEPGGAYEAGHASFEHTGQQQQQQQQQQQGVGPGGGGVSGQARKRSRGADGDADGGGEDSGGEQQAGARGQRRPSGAFMSPDASDRALLAPGRAPAQRPRPALVKQPLLLLHPIDRPEQHPRGAPPYRPHGPYPTNLPWSGPAPGSSDGPRALPSTQQGPGGAARSAGGGGRSGRQPPAGWSGKGVVGASQPVRGPSGPGSLLPGPGSHISSPGSRARVMPAWMGMMGITPGLGVCGVSAEQLASNLQQQGYTEEHVHYWKQHIAAQLELLTAAGAIMRGMAQAELAARSGAYMGMGPPRGRGPALDAPSAPMLASRQRTSLMAGGGGGWGGQGPPGAQGLGGVLGGAPRGGPAAGGAQRPGGGLAAAGGRGRLGRVGLEGQQRPGFHGLDLGLPAPGLDALLQGARVAEGMEAAGGGGEEEEEEEEGGGGRQGRGHDDQGLHLTAGGPGAVLGHRSHLHGVPGSGSGFRSGVRWPGQRSGQPGRMGQPHDPSHAQGQDRHTDPAHLLLALNDGPAAGDSHAAPQLGEPKPEPVQVGAGGEEQEERGTDADPAANGSARGAENGHDSDCSPPATRDDATADLDTVDDYELLGPGQGEGEGEDDEGQEGQEVEDSTFPPASRSSIAAAVQQPGWPAGAAALLKVAGRRYHVGYDHNVDSSDPDAAAAAAIRAAQTILGESSEEDVEAGRVSVPGRAGNRRMRKPVTEDLLMAAQAPFIVHEVRMLPNGEIGVTASCPYGSFEGVLTDSPTLVA
ncbi:hypothetical protein QJQ45_025936 [Haematococcus lacustris]|nr:hypothetical protein QJQ45_025936 [Haematococcus lacustris]